MKFLNLNAEGKPYLPQVRELYDSAFPAEEKKPFAAMEALAKEGKMELTAILEETCVGLAFFMLSDRTVILDYFAVMPGLRGGGYGGKAVRMIMERFKGRKLIFEIEMPDENAPNARERSRRKAFYLRNGMKETGVFANVYDTDFELLTADGSLTYEEYEEMLRFIMGQKGLEILKPRKMEMDYSIVYSSRSGNTAMLADKIKEVFAQEKCRYAGEVSKWQEEETAVSSSQVIFAGFWTDKGSCAEDMKDFLKSLNGKEVFLFGTAGFGGSREYYEKILNEVQKYLDASNTVIGTYMCQGRMAQGVRKRYEHMLADNPSDRSTQKMIGNFDAAAEHPGQQDLDALERAARQAVRPNPDTGKGSGQRKSPGGFPRTEAFAEKLRN